jgi:hypothetical protein
LEEWEATVRSIADGLGVVWPNEPQKVAREAGEILRARHRHYRATDDAMPTPIGPLTTRAWRAAQYGLQGEEAAAQALFDETRKVIVELDRLSAPHQERIERRLAAAEAALNRLKELLGNFRAASSETNPRSEPLNDELQGSAAQISHNQDDLIKLQAELSERVNEGERLRQQIDSIRASICWRITSPIRWFHKQVNGWLVAERTKDL